MANVLCLLCFELTFLNSLARLALVDSSHKMAHSLVIKLRIGRPSHEHGASPGFNAPTAAPAPTSTSTPVGRPPSDFALSVDQREALAAKEKSSLLPPKQQELAESPSTEIERPAWSLFSYTSPIVFSSSSSLSIPADAESLCRPESVTRRSPSLFKHKASLRPKSSSQAPTASRGNLDGSLWSSADVTLLVSLAEIQKATTGSVDKAAWGVIREELSVSRSEKAVQRKYEYELAKRRGLVGREANRGSKGVVLPSKVKAGSKKCKTKIKPQRRIKSESPPPAQSPPAPQRPISSSSPDASNLVPSPENASAPPFEIEIPKSRFPLVKSPSITPVPLEQVYDSQTSHFYSNFSAASSAPVSQSASSNTDDSFSSAEPETAGSELQPMEKEEWLEMGRLHGWVDKDEGKEMEEATLVDEPEAELNSELSQPPSPEVHSTQEVVAPDTTYEWPTIAPLQLSPLVATASTFPPIFSPSPQNFAYQTLSSAYTSFSSFFAPHDGSALPLGHSAPTSAMHPFLTPSARLVQLPTPSEAPRHPPTSAFDYTNLNGSGGLEDVSIGGWGEEDWGKLERYSAPQSEAEALLAKRCSEFFRRG